ncbi:GMC family oxidoreductase [Microbacterium sp. A94]|uniref:GMC family oxidoreductase n=1 Tax=Microbacterium sp. A94 TaxID=3450717 RepID=UPI003F4369B2
MSRNYDYIIVGAGAAGSTLAYRLSNDPSVSVLVLENGPGAGNPIHSVPKGFFFTLKGNRYTYNYQTAPIAGTQNVETWTRGKVAGGSTTVNGMMWNRGFQTDYDNLAEHAGDSVWNWNGFLSAYRAMEDHDLGEGKYRGVGGRLGISAGGATGELADRIFAAGQSLGLEKMADVNSADTERIGYTPSTVKRGQRTSPWSAYLRPALRRSNVDFETRTWVSRVVIQDGRATGVQGTRKGQPVEFRARREVIVAGGTIESTLLLERSGVGKPNVLRAAGVEVLVEAPQLGERIIEQHGPASVQARLTKNLGATLELNNLVKQGAQGALYLLTRRGPIATAGYDFTFYVKSEPGLDRPDMMGSITPFAVDPTATSMTLADHPGMLVGMYQIRPETQSSLHLTGTEQSDLPLIEPRYFETELDQRASSRGLGRSRELLAQAPLADIIAGEDFPTDAVSSEPETAIEYARHYGTTIYHAVGSAAMGRNDDDVVDSRLRVRGVQGLRVVDASVLPFQVSGNTAAPVMALGWIAGGFIHEG